MKVMVKSSFPFFAFLFSTAFLRPKPLNRASNRRFQTIPKLPNFALRCAQIEMEGVIGFQVQVNSDATMTVDIPSGRWNFITSGIPTFRCRRCRYLSAFFPRRDGLRDFPAMTVTLNDGSQVVEHTLRFLTTCCNWKSARCPHRRNEVSGLPQIPPMQNVYFQEGLFASKRCLSIS